MRDGAGLLHGIRSNYRKKKLEETQKCNIEVNSGYSCKFVLATTQLNSLSYDFKLVQHLFLLFSFLSFIFLLLAVNKPSCNSLKLKENTFDFEVQELPPSTF